MTPPAERAKLIVMRRLAPAVALELLAVGCGDGGPSAFSTGPGVTSLPQTTTGSESSSSTSGAEDSAAASASSGGLDMGGPPDFGTHQPLGCRGKIDFLFLISRLHTMTTEQQQLLGSLPGFIDTITTTFPDFDAHIMVANPDGTWTGWVCEQPHLCGQTGSCGPSAADYVCGPDTWLTVTECDETLGAGLTFNAGGNATNRRCELYGGHRYITLPGEPDPAAAFDCIARVGTSGAQPPTGDALIAAVSPELNAAEGCNAGFLRPDALLVVTAIMDNEDQKSMTKPADWYEAIVAAKSDPDSVVVLPIVPQPLVGEPAPNCTYDEGYKPKLEQLAEMFRYHAEGDVCAPSYVPFFEQAASLVGEACDSFIPQ